MKFSIFSLLGLSLSASLSATELKEGTITLLIKRGEIEQTVLYTKKGENLRLEFPGKHIPAKPYNLVDSPSGDVKIARPLNSTWTLVPAKRLTVRKPSALPEPPAPPANIGARPGPAGVPGTPPSAVTPNTPATPHQPPLSKGSPVPASPKSPKIPTPTLPDGSPLPKGIGPQPDGDKPSTPASTPGIPRIPGVNPGMPSIPGGMPSGMPGAPPMMPMMPMQQEEMKLQKGKESKTINGYLCHRYLMILPGEGEMTLWLSDAKDLPPFHLPLHEAPRNRGRVDWREQWPAVLRERKLFPMLAILHTSPPKNSDEKKSKKADQQGREIARWQVTDVSVKPIADETNTLFSIPKNYHQLESPQF